MRYTVKLVSYVAFEGGKLDSRGLRQTDAKAVVLAILK
jgi:hypothetical protein